jgi:hypothetical protein
MQVMGFSGAFVSLHFYSDMSQNFWQKDCCFVNFADSKSFARREKIKKNICEIQKFPPASE